MKVKEWFKTLISGAAIGVGAAIPGVSGGTIAVIFKVYEKILWAVSNLFKHFKKAVSILLPVLLGIIIALIPAIILMNKALNNLLFATVCLFAGFIIGSFPSVKDEVKNEKIGKKEIIFLIIGLTIALGIGILSIFFGGKVNVSSHFLKPEIWFYFVMIPVGILGSIALVVPGISGSMVLLLIGFYKPLIDRTSEVLKEIVKGNWSNVGPILGILLCFGIGVLIGFYIISKIMHHLLNKYHLTTFYAIIGFIIGSTIALFANNEIYQYYLKWQSGQHGYVTMQNEIIIGACLLVVGVLLSYLLVRYLRKNKEIENKK